VSAKSRSATGGPDALDTRRYGFLNQLQPSSFQE
jgi:hypothetical protein